MGPRVPARLGAEGLRPGGIALALWLGACASPADGPGDDRFDWYGAEVEVEGLPAGAAWVPVSSAVDFSELLSGLGVPGAVDERSIGLFQVGIRVPCQFTPFPQPRVQAARRLAGTVPGASYGAEFAPGESPGPIRVAGRLSWMGRSGAGGSARYRLRFGVPRSGRQVQVPFPPQNLRGFDAEGRSTPVLDFPRMQLHPQSPKDGVVHFFDSGQEVTAYHVGPAPEVRRPFFYPVVGPDGVGLTELGKPHDPSLSHAHHYSLWIAHASVAGKDFWSEKGGQILHERFESMEDGPVFCELVELNRWVFGEETLLRELRSLRLYAAAPSFRLIDLDCELSAAGKDPVRLGQTSFGLLAARVAQSMTPFDGGGEIVNSQGDRNEQSAHLRPADWIDQSGPIGPDRWNGLAILNHPENPHSPIGWHCRNDGWAGAASTLAGPLDIAPGRPARFRYRLVLHRGNAESGEVKLRYEDYRAGVQVRIGNASR